MVCELLVMSVLYVDMNVNHVLSAGGGEWQLSDCTRHEPS